MGEDEAFELGFEKQVDMWKEGEVEVGEILPKYIPLLHPFFILCRWHCFLHRPFWLVNAYKLPYKKNKNKNEGTRSSLSLYAQCQAHRRRAIIIYEMEEGKEKKLTKLGNG